MSKFDDYDDFDNEDEEFEDFEDFEDYDDFEDSFDYFDDDLDSIPKEEIDIFDEKPLETDSGYEKTAVEVHISKQLTSRKIIELIDTYPSLKRITCPPSIYKRISPKYLAALDDLDISVEVKHNWGKKKYSKEVIENVVNLFNEGYTADKIAEEMEMNIKEINYLKSKYFYKIKMKNYKKKYDDVLREKIKSLKIEGYKVKEISEMENIPLRSVYYILNNK